MTAGHHYTVVPHTSFLEGRSLAQAETIQETAELKGEAWLPSREFVSHPLSLLPDFVLSPCPASALQPHFLSELCSSLRGYCYKKSLKSHRSTPYLML